MLTWELISEKDCKSTFESFVHEINQSDLSSDFPPSPGSPQCQCNHPALLALLRDGAPRAGFDPSPASAPSWCSLLLLPDMIGIIIHSAVKRCGIMRVVGTDFPVNALQAHLTYLNAAG